MHASLRNGISVTFLLIEEHVGVLIEGSMLGDCSYGQIIDEVPATVLLRDRRGSCTLVRATAARYPGVTARPSCLDVRDIMPAVDVAPVHNESEQRVHETNPGRCASTLLHLQRREGEGEMTI